MLEMISAKFWAFCIPDDIESANFWKIRFFCYFPCISQENVGLWVKSGWYGRSGLVVRSSAHNPKLQVRSHLPPLWDPTSVLVGGAPSGDYFSPKSPFWKWELRYFLIFNKTCQSLIIIVDLALCTGYNICGGAPSGGYFSRPFWKLGIRYLLNLHRTCQNLMIIVDLALCTG